MYSALNDSIVGFYNHTLKSKMFGQFTAPGSHEWLFILPKLVHECNNSKHKSINMTPIQADANPTLVKIKLPDITIVKTNSKLVLCQNK